MADTASNPILPLDFSDVPPIHDAVRSDDIALLLQAAPGGMGLLASVLLVVGGGAAFRFYSQWIRNKHEERMSFLRAEEDRRQSDRAWLEAQMGEIREQISELVLRLDAVVKPSPAKPKKRTGGKKSEKSAEKQHKEED